MSRRTDQLLRIEQALGRIEGVLARAEHALDLDKPGGLAAVMSVARDAAADAKAAREHAEYANAGMQALASAATAKPGLPELTEAVGAHTDALRSMEATVRATGPQPVVSMPAPPAAPAAKPAPKPAKGSTA